VKKIGKLASISLLLLTSFVALGVSPDKSQLEAMYDKAFKAFDNARYDEALKALDAIDARQPDLAESLNLRGVVYMRQKKYDKAEAAFRKALSIEPKFWNASFNLAEIPFLKGDWVEARNRFEALIAGDNKSLQPETAQLIQYKILLTFVRQGKENMVDWILNKFEGAKDSPALYYANAALAFQHGNEKEAKEWVSAANKRFADPLNKLYAESFYEIGWMQKPPGEQRPAIEITSTTERAERMKSEVQANYEKAERAFEQRNFDEAAKFLERAEAGAPNDPRFENLRGEILMEQGKLDEAESAFREAVSRDGKFREAQYNLALISFKRGDYEKARDQFEKLFGATPGDSSSQAAQLLKFKIFLTLLLEGKEEQAQQLMDQFKFTGDTPALYYSHAAWEFKHERPDQGADWVRSARKIYSPALNIVFADSFYDLGWLKAPGKEPAPILPLAQAGSSSSTEPRPAMRLGPAGTVPEPAVAGDTGETVTTAQTPGPAGSPQIAATPSVATSPATAVTTPAATPPGATAASGAATETQATSAAAKTPEPTAAPVVAAKKPSTAGSPASASSSEPVRDWSSSSPNMMDRFSRPGTLIVVLLLAGILLLIGLVVQQARRNMANVPLYPSSAPLTEPSFDEAPSDLREKPAGREFVATGPPRLSLDLKASEPAVRAAVLPPVVVTARGAIPGVAEPPLAPSEEMRGPISPVRPPAKPAALEAQPPAPVMSDIEAPIEEAALPELAVAETKPEEKEVVPDLVEATKPPTEEPAEEAVVVAEEPVAQGQPVPELTTALSPEPDIPELTRSEPDSPLELIEAETELALPVAGHRPAHSGIETPSFASKIISSEPIHFQPTTPVIMPELTSSPVSTQPVVRTPSTSPTMSVQQPAGGMHTAVQLTFSLEIASMQLTPTFKMSGLQLKPISRVVSMRLAPSNDPQPPMNLQVTFEVAKIDLSNGSIGTVRLQPSVQEKPAALTSPSFAISGLELVPGKGAAPVQLTPSHQEQASVHLTAEFQIAAIEFTPQFEISTIVLNSTSRKVSMQLPGSGPSSIDSAPVFEIENVQLGPGSELGLLQVTPGTGARA
jgi:Flp pilus assembly protein TadD